MKKTLLHKQAFTLIELLVVIVIIGVLATVSTAVFSGNREKALVAKHLLQRNQATKEIFGNCVAAGFQHCGPNFMLIKESPSGAPTKIKNIDGNPGALGDILLDVSYGRPKIVNEEFMVYSTSGGVYKKRLFSDPTVPGTLFADSGSVVTISMDMRTVFIRSGSTIYYKDIDDPDTDLSNANVFLTANVGNTSGYSVSLDGLYMYYSEGGDVYKKLIGSNPSDQGERLLAISGNVFYSDLEANGEFLIHSGSATSYILHKKDLNGLDPWGSSPGTSLGQVGFIHYISFDGQYIYFDHGNQGLKKIKITNDGSATAELIHDFPHADILDVFP